MKDRTLVFDINSERKGKKEKEGKKVTLCGNDLCETSDGRFFES